MVRKVLKSLVIIFLWNSLEVEALPNLEESKNETKADAVSLSNLKAVSVSASINESDIKFALQKEDRQLSASRRNMRSFHLPRIPIPKIPGTHALDFGVQIPIPENLPDPTLTVKHHLDFWPYKRYYSLSVSGVLNLAYKLGHYLYDFAFLGLKILWQVFDIFQMKKSFDQLNHKPGWGWDGDDKRQLVRRLLN